MFLFSNLNYVFADPGALAVCHVHRLVAFIVVHCSFLSGTACLHKSLCQALICFLDTLSPVQVLIKSTHSNFLDEPYLQEN